MINLSPVWLWNLWRGSLAPSSGAAAARFARQIRSRKTESCWKLCALRTDWTFNNVKEGLLDHLYHDLHCYKTLGGNQKKNPIRPKSLESYSFSTSNRAKSCSLFVFLQLQSFFNFSIRKKTILPISHLSTNTSNLEDNLGGRYDFWWSRHFDRYILNIFYWLSRRWLKRDLMAGLASYVL